MRTKTIIAIIVIIFIATDIGAYYTASRRAHRDSTAAGNTAPSGTLQADMDSASSTVVGFGTQLKMISLLAPNASSTIGTLYAPYVAPDLLAQWEADPGEAPGRQVSSPWPDHIEIASIVPQGGEYAIEGTIVLMTSNEVEHGGNAGLIPFTAQVANMGGSWQITAFGESRQG